MASGESGNAIVFTIAVSALSLAILSLMVVIINHQLNLTSAFTDKVKTNLGRQNLLAKSLHGAGNSNLVKLQEFDTPYPSRIVRVSDASDSLYSATQSTRSNNVFLLPDWGALKRKLPSITCPLANKTPTSESIRTCSFQDITIDNSAVFVGNLKAKKLILNNVSNARFTLAVLGSLEADELVLSNLKNMTFDIMSAGPVKINATTSENVENSLAFILSAIDSIVINSTEDFCDVSNGPKNRIQMLLNANKIVLNNNAITPRVYGCSYSGPQYVGGIITVGISPNLFW